MFSANRMHENSFYSNKLINDTFELNRLENDKEQNKRILEAIRVETVQDYFNLTVIQRKDLLLFELCKTCNDNSLQIISKYNSKFKSSYFMNFFSLNFKNGLKFTE